MNNIYIQYAWIFTLGAVILLVGLLTFNKKEDKLEYILKEVEKIQEEQKALTEREKELKELSTQKEWEEVDK